MLVAKGLEGVIANESRLSEVDGANGKLCYLGYTIDDLVANCTFEEVMYLLYKSKLPNQSEIGRVHSGVAETSFPARRGCYLLENHRAHRWERDGHSPHGRLSARSLG